MSIAGDAGQDAGKPVLPPSALPSGNQTLADGEWHRLHPATPLLRGGIVFIAIIGFVIASMRERLVDLFVPGRDGSGAGEYFDPLDYVFRQGIVGLVLLGVVVLVVLIVALSYLSWRFHTFRVTNESVEVRSGVLFRTHRQAKLDRVQGVEINKPIIARLFGAAKLDVSVAGQNANVKLEYLGGRAADDLRRDILTLASGIALAKERGVDPASLAGPAGVVDPNDNAITRAVVGRANELLSSEVDSGPANYATAVRIPAGRVIASTIVGSASVFAIILTVVAIVLITRGQFWTFFWFIPALIGIVSYLWNSVAKALRYSIADTPSGVRVSFGLLSTVSDTLPPGRVHAIEVSQSVLWRPFGWWQLRINKAGLSAEQSASGAGNTTVMPVGRIDDAGKVISLLLSDVESGETVPHLGAIIKDPRLHGFTVAPRRAFWLDPFAWRRTGYAIHNGVLLLRRGVIWRRFTVIPLARMQSLQVTQGPLQRAFGLASASAHTVFGPVSPTLPVVGVDDAVRLFETVSASVVTAIAADRSHRWAEEAPAQRDEFSPAPAHPDSVDQEPGGTAPSASSPDQAPDVATEAPATPHGPADDAGAGSPSTAAPTTRRERRLTEEAEAAARAGATQPNAAGNPGDATGDATGVAPRELP